jgi:hypothetical protein
VSPFVGVPIGSPVGAYSFDMVRRAGWAELVTISVAAIGWTCLGAAPVFAGQAPFRYEHGEPLNNLSLTPGAVFKVSAATICQTGYAEHARDVPESEKLAVYAEYGITYHPTNRYEIDHLIPLELGGSNSTANLWPELNDHPKGYLNSKDRLEDRLHQLVCRGQIAFAVAQRLIATDWVSAYHRSFGIWPSGSVATYNSPASSTPTTTASSGGGAVQVSVLSPVAPGVYEALIVRSVSPNAHCVLSVTLPSGAQSAAVGLGSVIASSSGIASWSWRIGTNIRAGVARATVACGSGSIVTDFTIS